MNRRSPRFVGVFAAAAITLGGQIAHASTDYDLASTEWNGLSDLANEAHTVGCLIESRSELDWAKLDGHDALWFVYPTKEVDPQNLRRFLISGGRAVIADDFGRAGAALDALEIHRFQDSESLPDNVPRFHESPGLPIATPSLLTALGRSTDSLVANHPSLLSTVHPATFQFFPGGGLVVEGKLGRGDFVALGDPSLLINNMMAIDGNRRFVRALVQESCRSVQDRIVVVSGPFRSVGEPVDTLPHGPVNMRSLSERVNGTLLGMNRALEEDWESYGNPLFAAAFATGLLLIFLRVFPARQKLTGHWLGAARSRQIAQTEDLGPALAEEVFARVQAVLPEVFSVRKLAPAAVAKEMRRHFSDEVGVLTGDLWREIRRSENPLFAALTGPISGRRLSRMHRLASDLFALIERN